MIATVPFSTSIVGTLTLAAVIGIGTYLWRTLLGQNKKLDRMANYLFQAKTGKDGIPAPLGKIAEIDTTLEQHSMALKKLDRGQLEVLRRLKMSNGITIAEGIEALQNQGDT